MCLGMEMEEDFSEADLSTELTELGFKKETLKEIETKVRCRQKQVNYLLRLLCPFEDNLCTSIFIYGHTGTGKTYVIKTLCNTLKIPYSYTSCVENYTAKHIYHSILSQLCHHVGITNTNFLRSDNMNDFLRNLRHISNKNEGKGMYIVLDKAERLRQMEFHLFPAFLQLSDFLLAPLTVIFITDITWEKFLIGTGLPTPVFICFPEYNQIELTEIMGLDCPPEQFKSFYKAYCNLILHVFLVSCRDINELRHLARINFPTFCEPLHGEQGSVAQIRSLWRNVESSLRKSLSSVYLRTAASSQLEKVQAKEAEEFGSTRLKAALDLPYFSKYLLIAGYLASHNPPQTDRRFFCKERQAKMSKRGKTSAKKRDSGNRLAGPKAFPLDRLLAIFCSILDGKVTANANLMSQVASLCTLCLFHKATTDDQLDIVKYKCTVTFDFIKSVAASVEFEIGQYLYDYT